MIVLDVVRSRLESLEAIKNGCFRGRWKLGGMGVLAGMMQESHRKGLLAKCFVLGRNLETTTKIL
jgi:hypothetical protein